MSSPDEKEESVASAAPEDRRPIPADAKLLGEMHYAASALRVAVLDQGSNGEVACWFRPLFLRDVADMLTRAADLLASAGFERGSRADATPAAVSPLSELEKDGKRSVASSVPSDAEMLEWFMDRCSDDEKYWDRDAIRDAMQNGYPRRSTDVRYSDLGEPKTELQSLLLDSAREADREEQLRSRAATTPEPPSSRDSGSVTEEDVERALNVWMGDAKWDEGIVSSIREDMWAVLESFLASRRTAERSEATEKPDAGSRVSDEEVERAVMDSTPVRRALVGLVWRVGVDVFDRGLDGASRGASDFERCIQPGDNWQGTDRGSAARVLVQEVLHASREAARAKEPNSDVGESFLSARRPEAP